MKKISLLTLNSILLTPLFLVTSCQESPEEKLKKLDETLKEDFASWYQDLSLKSWNKDENGNFINHYCDSEQQAITLYANFWGSFWNEELHQNKEPLNKTVNFKYVIKETLKIRGQDYKYIVAALDRGKMKRDVTVYHGVEYMENEFYDQLKDFISLNQDGSYNYEKCVGQEIQTYGFISTTLSKDWATSFVDGWNWTSHNEEKVYHLPLKEPALFVINIRGGDYRCCLSS